MRQLWRAVRGRELTISGRLRLGPLASVAVGTVELTVHTDQGKVLQLEVLPSPVMLRRGDRLVVHCNIAAE